MEEESNAPGGGSFTSAGVEFVNSVITGFGLSPGNMFPVSTSSSPGGIPVLAQSGQSGGSTRMSASPGGPGLSSVSGGGISPGMSPPPGSRMSPGLEPADDRLLPPLLEQLEGDSGLEAMLSPLLEHSRERWANELMGNKPNAATAAFLSSLVDTEPLVNKSALSVKNTFLQADPGKRSRAESCDAIIQGSTSNPPLRNIFNRPSFTEMCRDAVLAVSHNKQQLNLRYDIDLEDIGQNPAIIAPNNNNNNNISSLVNSGYSPPQTPQYYPSARNCYNPDWLFYNNGPEDYILPTNASYIPEQDWPLYPRPIYNPDDSIGLVGAPGGAAVAPPAPAVAHGGSLAPVSLTPGTLTSGALTPGGSAPSGASAPNHIISASGTQGGPSTTAVPPGPSNLTPAKTNRMSPKSKTNKQRRSKGRKKPNSDPEGQPIKDDSNIVNNGMTTIMLRNIPNKYTQKMLLEVIDEKFKGLYDFFYLPIDFRNKCNVGYAFINFLDSNFATMFKKEFDGLKLSAFKSNKVCEVSWGRVQGLTANIEHYRNSAVMSIPIAQFKPLLFKNGVPIPFPVADGPLPSVKLRPQKC